MVDTPVVFNVPANVNTSICREVETITIGQASATACNTSLTVTGQVISTNGVTLTTPIPVSGGQATLSAGAHVVRWTPSNPNVAPRTQTVLVRATIEARESFLLDDRAQLTNLAGGFAGLLSSGTGATRFGMNTHARGVLSVGPVTLLSGAIADGNVTSASTVSKDPTAVINGTTAQFGVVNLPALPSLPAFPAPTGGSITINSGQTSSPGAGSYATVALNSGGTLVLGAGDYFFQTLTLNGTSTVRTAATTRVFVRDQLTFLSPFLMSSGTAIRPIFLGFQGTTLAMNVRFDGTLVAPNAAVTFGTGPGIAFTGGFYARTIEIHQDSTLICQAARAAP